MKHTEWHVEKLPVTGQPVIYAGTELMAGGLTEANTNLVVTAVNACIRLNPDNPIAVAEGISDLYEACKAQHQAIDTLFAKLIALDKNFFPSKSGIPWQTCVQGHKVITEVKKKPGV